MVVINEGLCRQKQALLKTSTSGYVPAQKLWEKCMARELSLREVLAVCRQRHQLAPFWFYNGDTLVAIGRTLIQDLLHKMPPEQAHTFRSVIGHNIASTINQVELDKALKH